MPLKQSASLRQNSNERLVRSHAREAAVEKYGESRVEGKQVHHKNGNNKDNRPSNLSLINPTQHGQMHGRGHGRRGDLNIKNK